MAFLDDPSHIPHTVNHLPFYISYSSKGTATDSNRIPSF